MTSRIFTPPTLDEAGAFDFIAQLERSTGSLIVDFSDTQFALPLGALMLASAYRRFVTTQDAVLKAEGINLDLPAHSYLGHMGFFKSMGIPVGKRPGESPGSSTYIPITVLDIADLEGAHRSKLLETYDEPPIGSLVDVEAMKLAKLVTQDLRPKINRPMGYCFREIIRNVFEHSGEKRCAIYAQRWANGFIEVAIVDRGKGIRNSLEGKQRVENDRDALMTAMTAGVSGSAKTPDGQWGNSGFGLFVLSELGKALGSFSLCSGNTSALASEGAVVFAKHHASFWGTAVGLKIRQLSPNQFRQLVDDIVGRGEEIVRGRGENVRASKSTRIDDF
jgi:hypothetical protein